MGIASAIYLAASACTAFVGAALVGDTEAVGLERRPTSRGRPAAPIGRDASARPSLEHNPFCPSCVPEGDAPPPTPSVADDLPFGGVPRTGLPLELVATMEAEPPGRSIATLASPEGSGAVAAAVGDVVLPQVRLARIDGGAVLLDNAGQLELLEQGEVKKPPKGKEPRRERKPRRRRRWQIEGARDAIACDGLECTVEREFIEELTGNPALLASQARVRPYARKGVRGFRLSRVRSGTIPRLLGLRSGDVVTEINGRDLHTMDAALAMASRLRTASHLSVEVTRRRGGERSPLELEIQIVS